MNRLSLRLRLVLAGAVAVVAALVLAGLALGALFATHVERRAAAELAIHLDRTVAGIAQDPGGGLILATPPTDPRFDRPYGGLYWQIETPDGLLRSRSLWDRDLPLPPDTLGDGQAHLHRIAGPDGQALLALERAVRLSPRLGGVAIRAAVAVDRGDLIAAQRAFMADLAPYLAVLAVVLIAAGAAQVAVGLRPLRGLGDRVLALRRGTADRMGEDWPREVRPLATEIDALLAARAEDVDRARARAGDLAHGLKTPLQALLGEADRLRADGDTRAAEGLVAVATAMRRHVDRELIRSRTAHRARHAKADIARAVRRLLAVLQRTPDGARREWIVRTDGAGEAAMDEADLAEALGALMENAARHATSRVEIDCRPSGGAVALSIRDDGPGIPAADRARLLTRGARLDEDGPGTGLGLAIAADIADAAGGSLILSDANPGLAATLTVPASPPAR